jgi:hypothetical protein
VDEDVMSFSKNPGTAKSGDIFEWANFWCTTKDLCPYYNVIS